jgi:chromosome segregation ATPase
VEGTPTLYRLRGTVGAGQSKTPSVTAEDVQGEAIAGLPADRGQLEVHSHSRDIPRRVRQALSQAMQLKRARLDRQRQIQETQQRLAEIAQEQQRIRDSLAAASSTTQGYQRVLAKSNEQGTHIESLQAELAQLKRPHGEPRRPLEG